MQSKLSRHDDPNRARRAAESREQGATWAEIADEFGYANPRSARTSVLSVARSEAHRQWLVEAVPRQTRTPTILDNGNGYKRLKDASHPLANGQGWLYVHRAVLYAKVGDGPHPCHHCGRTLQWRSNLQVDHLDHDRSNNEPANLVPSCGPCNTKRRRALVHTSTSTCYRGHPVHVTPGGWRYCPTCRIECKQANGYRACSPIEDPHAR